MKNTNSYLGNTLIRASVFVEWSVRVSWSCRHRWDGSDKCLAHYHSLHAVSMVGFSVVIYLSNFRVKICTSYYSYTCRRKYTITVFLYFFFKTFFTNAHTDLHGHTIQEPEYDCSINIDSCTCASIRAAAWSAWSGRMVMQSIKNILPINIIKYVTWMWMVVPYIGCGGCWLWWCVLWWWVLIVVVGVYCGGSDGISNMTLWMIYYGCQRVARICVCMYVCVSLCVFVYVCVCACISLSARVQTRKWKIRKWVCIPVSTSR